jgi:hypothetical protein
MRITILALVFAAAVAPAAENESVQSVMDNVLTSDPRNAGIEVAARSQFGGSLLVYDLKSIAPTTSMIDVFRVLLQFAQTQRDKSFTSVELAFRGKSRFLINGPDFKELGREYGVQNPIHIMRTLPGYVWNTDGTSAYPTQIDGLLAATASQMEQFIDLSKRWYLNDVIADSPSRGAHVASDAAILAAIHQIDYVVNGSADTVNLTYRNATGGTEQNEVTLPVNMTFAAAPGSFLYLSAQNKSGSGTVHVAISVDGSLLQEARSSSHYGIATASGRVR